MWFQE